MKNQMQDMKKQIDNLTIYGIIGESYWSDKYTSAIDVDNALKEANGNNVVIRLNSPGGSAFDGIAIYNRRGTIFYFAPFFGCVIFKNFPRFLGI
ncbi:hypothetical protein ACIQ1D_03320 [Lysinibacillus xylanilyticus]|uniref:hypothetical protein n=1 Tax=Lysinibacillus xylanilyticus TaxID=582475 RepID=UPI00380D1616